LPHTSLEPSPDAERLAAIEADLAEIGTLDEEPVSIPGLRATLDVLRPTDTDRLLERTADDPEQNLPYWAELWPSGIALAAAIARQPHLVRGRRTLEIGCGLGITAAMAVALGARLLATDYAPEALLLARRNTLRFAGEEPETLQLNWRAPDNPLLAAVEDDFAVVLAADVLYEARDVAPLLDLIERVIAPRGLLWLAEPGRRPAARFLEQAAHHGWSGTATEWDGPWPDVKDEGVIVRVHQLRRRARAVRDRQRQLRLLDKKP
jgi:predicted nicotinamide N-methyase